ncbi:MAG: TraR/DksA C4-type zinc finger protein [bacterium]
MAKTTKKTAKTKAKTVKKSTPATKIAAKKTASKPAPIKVVKKVVAKKVVQKKVVAKSTPKPINSTTKTVKESAKKPVKNLAPMQLTANDNDVVANSKVRYNAKDLDMFTKVILEQRSEASEEFDIISQQLMDTSGEFDGENQSFALHTAEQGSDAMEREKHFLQAQRTSDYIKKLDEAIERINRGTYGICVICGELIEKQRLFAVPITQKHVLCKNKTQRKTFSRTSSEAAYLAPEEVID